MAEPKSSRKTEVLATSSTSSSSKRTERLNKLKELHMRRNEARNLNHQEVVEEDKRKKMPENWERKRKQAEWELEEDSKRKAVEATGEDYDRVKLLSVGADEAERASRMKRKKNPDPGFSDYEAATFRQYSRLTKQLKPDKNNYEKQREQMGDDFYASTDSLIHGTHKPSEEKVDRLVEDLEKQIEKRGKFSRRRTVNDDADIDFINERNAKFNKKLERFYGKYTAEIKQNLERGTAV